MGRPPALSAVPRRVRGTAPPPAGCGARPLPPPEGGGRRLPEADGEGGRLASFARVGAGQAAGHTRPKNAKATVSTAGTTTISAGWWSR